MDPLTLYSEPFAPTGSISASGAIQSLGRPNMDMLVVLIREAVQNSWDARIRDGRVVHFNFSSEPKSGRSADQWRSAFSGRPTGLPLDDVLEADSFEVLYVRDSNTRGLTGSTRADRIDDEDEMDFVDFVRNVGQPTTAEYGGGTYGYGKSVFYLASACRTVLTYTRTEYQGRYESRLIGSALGEYHSDADGMPYTGRHWWGIKREGIIEPILNEEADAIASDLGFMPYSDSESGTTIAVIGFEGFDQEGDTRPARQAVEVMAEAVAWNCWPKYGLRTQDDEMSFSARWNNVEIPIPDSQIPVIQTYRRALDDIHSVLSGDEGGHVTQISSQRPAKDLGLLALRRTPRDESDYVPWVAPFVGPSHHVALMREPKLIVKYLPATPLAGEDVEWAGVFKADREVNYAFAKSEPPTHDDWVPEMLQRPEKVFVNVARRRILDLVEREMAPPTQPQDTSLTEPLGELSSRLGSLIALASGTGPRVEPRTDRGGVSRRRGFARANGEPRLTHRDGRRALIVPFHAEPIGDSATLTVIPQVLVDGGRTELDPPAGSEQPEILEVELGGQRTRESDLHIEGYVEGTVVISVPDDTMVRIAFDLVETDGSG